MRSSTVGTLMASAVLTTATLTGSVSAAADDVAKDVTIRREGWSFDRSKINWYDPAPAKVEEKKQKGLLTELCGWVEYDFEIAKPGWYELALTGGVPGWGRDVDLDGKRLLKQTTSGAEDKLEGETYKEANLHLEAGKHSLRFRRLGFPGVLPSGWRLRPADGEPAGCVFARVEGQNVIRATEKLKLSVTGGTSIPTEYELVARDTLRGGAEQAVGRVAFPAGAAAAQAVELPALPEGVYELRAKVGGKLLRPNDISGGKFIVVDTRAVPGAAQEARRTLIHDIDCVEQTDMGKPIVNDAGYWEAYGATRVVNAPFGSYREGGDNLDPDIPFPPDHHSGKFKSGFSYAIDVPESQIPYLLEVDYPDDDRRTVNVILLEGAKTADGLEYPAAQLGSGYETGDAFELTRAMQRHQVLFWPSQAKLRCALVSMNPGMRAAAAKIRLYRLDAIPMAAAGRSDGRILASFTEEPTRWNAYFRTFQPGLGAMERDFMGLQRYCQMARFAGLNAINPTEVVYNGCMTYNTEELEGWDSRNYDCPRITVLLCEKYGLRYIPELHISGQPWFHAEVVEKLVKDPAELYIYSRLGTSSRGEGNWFSSTWNPLHPAIQDKYIAVFGELADKLADSPAFGGVSSRLMSWVWQGWNGLPSLNWGYGDWDMAQFEKDTGVKVPGDANDPERFQKRFAFLTSEAMLPQWLAWRNGRMQSYLERLRDRIRRNRPEAVLYLPYHGDAISGMDLIFGSLLQTPRGALKEVGLDLDVLSKTPGIALVPAASFGRRNSSPLADASLHDALREPEHKALGMGYERAFGYGNAYFEVHQAVPIDKLGLPELKPGAYCGAADAAGRNILEKFSLALADQDTGYMFIGGLGYTFGQPEFLHEWLAEYENLPKQPFTPVDQARDPVAVWVGEAAGFRVQGSEKKPSEPDTRTLKPETFFYAVNREPYAATVVLDIAGAAAVTQLGTGAALPVKDGKLAIELKPYQLRAFRAAAGTRLTGAETIVPPERVEITRRQLAFCQQLADSITTGRRQGDVTDRQRAAFLKTLNAAWDAYAQRHYWRARSALAMAPMVTVYQALASWPDGLMQRQGSINRLATEVGVAGPPPVPMLDAEALSKHLVPGSAARLVDATAYDPEWRFTKVLVTDAGTLDLDLDVPVPGRYRLSIGHVADNYGAAVVSLGKSNLAQLIETTELNRSDRTVFPVLSLPAGPARLRIQRQGAFGVYGVTLQPVHTPLPSPNWMTIGPFAGVTDRFDVKGALKSAMDTVEPPEKELDFKAEYTGHQGRKIRWSATDKIEGQGVPHFTPEAGVSFLFRANVQQQRACYAVTFITSPDERDAELAIGCDWWAKAWLNGEPVTSHRPREKVEEDGASFNGWTPIPARIKLKKGVNALLVKSQGGTVANWFTCYLSDPGDLSIGRVAKKETE